VWVRLAELSGGRHRNDLVAPGGGGGPAGNARLTATTGLVLLALFLAELVTLLDVSGLISWHVAIGVLLVPPALLKTAVTGWRFLRYYGGSRDYRASGPPPMLLRLLGPLVVLSTLGLLGSGLTLIALGPNTSRHPLVTALGQRADAVTVHQAFFICWAVVTGLHVLARLGPAIVLADRRSAVPGDGRRLTAMIVTLVIAAIAATLLLGTADAWRRTGHGHARAARAADRVEEPLSGQTASGRRTSAPLRRLPEAGPGSGRRS
jgi:hypothetical protein